MYKRKSDSRSTCSSPFVSDGDVFFFWPLPKTTTMFISQRVSSLLHSMRRRSFVQSTCLVRTIGLRNLLIFLVKSNDETNNETDDDEDNDTDPEAPPFHPSGTTSTGNTLVKLSITGFGVLLDVLGVLFCLLNHGLLDDDSFGEILKELVELDKSTLDLLDIVVTGTNSSKDGRGSCCAICLELSWYQ